MRTDRNQIAIGILGPEALVNKVLRVITSFPSFLPVARIISASTNEALAQEASAVVQELLDEVEVLLVTGPGLYRRIKEDLKSSKPIHFIPLTDTELFRALYRIRKNGAAAPEFKLSIDSFSESSLFKMISEIGEQASSFKLLDTISTPSVQAMVAFHAELYQKNKIQAALTVEHEVYEALNKLGIPCEWITPTDQNIVVALERALLSTETRRSIESQIVVGMLNIDDFGKQLQLRNSEHEIQRLKLDIHGMLIDYVESLDGYLIHTGSDEYLYFTTRGIFERETGGYKTIPLARQVNRTLGLSLSMGIGFGRSANEAGTHARMALRQAKEAGGNTCFIVREDKTLIGPVEMADPLNYNLSVTDRDLLKKTEQVGMTSAYLSRLLQYVARTGKLEFEVHELSGVLDITVRSTHRLLLQWIDHGLVSIAGYVKVPRGRPKQTYRLSFLEEYE
jgi:hypothetical protein